MKTYLGQKIIQCLHFQDHDAKRYHLLIQLAGGDWYADSRRVPGTKPLTKTFIKRRCLTQSQFGRTKADVTTYDL